VCKGQAIFLITASQDSAYAGYPDVQLGERGYVGYRASPSSYLWHQRQKKETQLAAIYPT
jgi:hypothetical protein